VPRRRRPDGVLNFPPKYSLSAELSVSDLGPVLVRLRRDMAAILRRVAEGEDEHTRARLEEAAAIFEAQEDGPVE
jgi:hypothetical protein